MVLENSRNKSSLLGFQHEPENLVCFAKELNIPSTQEELRKSMTEWYGYDKLTCLNEMLSAFVAGKLKIWNTLNYLI